MRGQAEDAAIGVPRSDDLQADRQPIRGPAAWQRDGRVAGQVEGPEIGIPGPADRTGRLSRDHDGLVRVVVDGERWVTEGWREHEVEAIEQRGDLTVHRRPLRDSVGPIDRCPAGPPIDRLPYAERALFTAR